MTGNTLKANRNKSGLKLWVKIEMQDLSVEAFKHFQHRFWWITTFCLLYSPSPQIASKFNEKKMCGKGKIIMDTVRQQIFSGHKKSWRCHYYYLYYISTHKIMHTLQTQRYNLVLKKSLHSKTISMRLLVGLGF